MSMDDVNATPTVNQEPDLLSKIDAQVAQQGNGEPQNDEFKDDNIVNTGIDNNTLEQNELLGRVDQQLGNQPATTQVENKSNTPVNNDVTAVVFDSLKKVFGDDYVAPEGVTSENLHEKLIEETFKAYNESLPEEVREFYQHLQNGGTKENFNQEQTFDINKIPTDDLLVMSFSEDNLISDDNPDGMTKEQIENYVKNMDEMQKRMTAKQIRNSYNESKSAREEQQKIQQAEQFKQKVEGKNKENLQIIDNIVDKYKNVKDIYGLPVSQQQIQEFGKEFKELMLRDETGQSPAQKIIHDDEAFFKLMFLASKAGYTKDFLREARNQEVQDLKNKMPATATSFNQKQTNVTGINYDALAAPAKD